MSLQVKSTHFIGKTAHYYEEVSSTNETAKQLIAKTEPAHGTVILAEYQSKGRGQTSSQWESAPGKNLLLSILFKPEQLTIEQQFIVNMMISLSIAETVQQYVSGTTQIKWPNDIVIDSHKVCGILIENYLRGEYITHLIAGIGLNVNQVHFHSSLTRVTSLKLETGVDVKRQDVLEQLLVRIEEWIERYKNKEIALLRRNYLSKLYRYQEEHDYQIDGEQVKGEIMGVSEQGKLLVRIGNEVQHFANKEIQFL